MCSSIWQYILLTQNELDSKPQTGRKDSYICSWFYNYIITLMIKQLQWGIEEDLY